MFTLSKEKAFLNNSISTHFNTEEPSNPSRNATKNQQIVQDCVKEGSNTNTKNQLQSYEQDEESNKTIDISFISEKWSSIKKESDTDSYVHVLYFKKLKLHKKIFEKLKGKKIFLYLKYNDSTCLSEAIEVKSEELDNIFLCFLVTEPFMNENKKIIKIYIKYFKDDKYKILSFGIMNLDLLNFTETFYKKKCYLLCYDKNNKKYVFGYFLLILAHQKKWNLRDNRIVQEQVNHSYFIKEKENYDYQIFYICKKIQKILIESFHMNRKENSSKNALLKHFAVTQSCPSTFSLKEERNEQTEGERKWKKYCSLVNLTNIKKSDSFEKSISAKKDKETKKQMLLQPSTNGGIHKIAQLKKKKNEQDSDTEQSGEKEKTKKHNKTNQFIKENVQKNTKQADNKTITNKEDLYFCSRLQNILNHNLDNFLDEIQFVLIELKNKIVKNKTFFEEEIKKKYGKELVEEESTIHPKNDDNQQIQCGIITHLQNCMDTSLMYIQCVLKDSRICDYEKDVFYVYRDIITSTKEKLTAFVQDHKYLHMNPQEIKSQVHNRNITEERKKNKLKKTDHSEKKEKQHTDINEEEYYMSDSSLDSLHTETSSGDKSNNIFENFQLDQYVNQHISIALKFYEKKWKNKLMKMRN